MATIAISHDQDTIQAEIHISAPPERVFQAITDPRQLMQWWGQKGMYHSTEWKGDLRPGGEWRCDGVNDADGKPYHVGGEYVDVDPPRLLSYTWMGSFTGPKKTLVEWRLEADSGGTRVRLNHSGFGEASAVMQGTYQGWQRVIGWMLAYVEKGETMAMRPPVSLPSRS